MLKAMILACLATAAMALSYKECTSNSVVYVKRLSTSPYPPSLTKGFSATYDLGLREPIDGNVDVKLTLKAKLGFLWVTVPCVSQIGSCYYKDVCSLMEGNADQEVCDALDLPCRCPMPVTSLVGTYDVPPITGIPDSIKGFLNSDFQAKGEIIQNRRLIGCLQIAARINA